MGKCVQFESRQAGLSLAYDREGRMEPLLYSEVENSALVSCLVTGPHQPTIFVMSRKRQMIIDSWEHWPRDTFAVPVRDMLRLRRECSLSDTGSTTAPDMLYAREYAPHTKRLSRHSITSERFPHGCSTTVSDRWT